MSITLSGARGVGRRTRAVATTAAALAVAAAFAAPAGAAVNGSHVVAAIPKSSTLELSGYTPGTPLTVNASRNGVIIGTATTTVLGDGSAGVNPVDCWQGFTPELLPGDVITVAGGGITDTMTVTNIDATSMNQTAAGVDVHGVAIAPGGGQYDPTTFAASVQARISRPPGTLFPNHKNTLRAGAGKFDGTIAYDAPGTANTAWTAHFPLDAANTAAALSAKSFEGVFLIGVSELTIGRQPAAVPVAAGCPALQRNAVTQFSEPAVNLSNAGTPVTVTGVSQSDATSVSVAISDGAGHSVTATATPSGGTWATGPVDVSGLSDGTLTATPTMTVPTGTFAGATKTLLKDVVAPPAPVASLSPGTYTGPQTVSLGDADPAATIHFTDIAGLTPLPASPTFASPLTLSQSKTINAIAVDAAGNTSPAATFAYTIQPPATGGGAAAGTTTIINQIVNGSGSAAAGRLTVRGLSVRVLAHRRLLVSMRLKSGTAVVRLRVFRTRHGRATGAPVLTLNRIAASGRFVATLRSSTLQVLRPGRYVLEARAGNASRAFGNASRRAFTLR